MTRLPSARALGAVLLGTLLLTAIAADALAPHDPRAATGRPFEAPSRLHWLGTNDVGQDIFSELIHGTRVSLTIGLLAGFLAVALGTAIGLLAASRRGWIDALLLRVIDVVLVLPFLPLTILLAAYVGPSPSHVVVVIGLVAWARPARVVRAAAVTLAAAEDVLAARALGAGAWRVVRHHLLPQIAPLVVAQFVIVASAAIALEAGLAFLGLGDPTQKSWGTMLFYAQARNAFLAGTWPWWVVPPGLMIAAAVASLALLGQDAARPRS